MAIDHIENLDEGSLVRSKLNAAIDIVNTNENAQATITGHLVDKNNPHDTSWNNLLDVPADFPPEVHTHTETSITDLDRIRWAGVWAPGTYYFNDVVKQDTYTCVCIVTSTTDKPVDPTLSADWEILAKEETSGTSFVPDEFAGPATSGYVPDPVTTTGRYLKDDGTWDSPAVTTDFGDLTGIPTTIAGYGITDAYTELEVDGVVAASAATRVPLSGNSTVDGVLKLNGLQLSVTGTSVGPHLDVFWSENPPPEFNDALAGQYIREDNAWVAAPDWVLADGSVIMSGSLEIDGIAGVAQTGKIVLRDSTNSRVALWDASTGYWFMQHNAATGDLQFQNNEGIRMTLEDGGPLVVEGSTYSGQVKIIDDTGPTLSLWDNLATNRWALQFDLATQYIHWKYNGTKVLEFQTGGNILMNDNQRFQLGANAYAYMDYQSSTNNWRMLTTIGSNTTVSIGTNGIAGIWIDTDQTVNGVFNNNTTHNSNSKIVVLTSAQYAALGTPNADTLYFVTA